jgi:hypothetical protein
MANTIQTAEQSKWLFNYTGPSGSNATIAGVAQFTPEGLLNGSGWQSGIIDLGSVRNSLFNWRAKARPSPNAPSPTLGGTVELYLYTSGDAGFYDANLPSGNQVVTNLDKRRNLQYVGALSVDTAASGVPCMASGLVQAYARYVGVVWFNLTGTTLSSTQGDNLMELRPVPDQIESF